MFFSFAHFLLDCAAVKAPYPPPPPPPPAKKEKIKTTGLVARTPCIMYVPTYIHA